MTSLSIDSKALVALNDDYDKENIWWKSALFETIGYECDSDITTLKRLHKRACSQFFRGSISKEVFCQICFLTWMDSWNWFVDSLDFSQNINTVSNNDSMAQWMIPPLPPLPSYDNSELSQLRLGWMNLWKEYSNACRATCAPTTQQRPNKRLKVGLGGSNSFVEGSCALPFAYQMLRLLFYSKPSIQEWEELHNLVHKSIETHFKTFTNDDIQAALCLFGMDCLYSHSTISGLSPIMLLQNYVSPFGESMLAVFLNQHKILSPYALRACMCEHLLQPVYKKGEMEDDCIEKTIKRCAQFLNVESSKTYLSLFSSKATPKHSRKRRLFASQEQEQQQFARIPDRILENGYPILIHVGLFLLQDNVWSASKLVKSLEACGPEIDDIVKDEAWLTIFQYFFNEGNVFLDGNFVSSKNYQEKRHLLFKAVVSGMGGLGREAMIGFFFDLYEMVKLHPSATPEEITYVTRACQQTLLRLFFKSYGIGEGTISNFLERTKAKWPELASMAGTHANLEKWAERFLWERTEIPESLQWKRDVIEEEGFGKEQDLGRVRLHRFMKSLETDAEETRIPRITHTEHDKSLKEAHKAVVEELVEDDREEDAAIQFGDSDEEQDSVVGGENDYNGAEEKENGDDVQVFEDVSEGVIVRASSSRIQDETVSPSWQLPQYQGLTSSPVANGVEDAEIEVSAFGGEIGDTTEEENDDRIGIENANADAIRRADALSATRGYASQLEEGYEPEDTHGYTEEEVSEAIHTEDEEEEQRGKEAVSEEIVEIDISQPKDQLQQHVQLDIPHSSDDMDEADEHTEQEEDLGAESSELEEAGDGLPPTQQAASPIRGGKDPTTLWEYAQTAQRQHDRLTLTSEGDLNIDGAMKDSDLVELDDVMMESVPDQTMDESSLTSPRLNRELQSLGLGASFTAEASPTQDAPDTPSTPRNTGSREKKESVIEKVHEKESEATKVSPRRSTRTQGKKQEAIIMERKVDEEEEKPSSRRSTRIRGKKVSPTKELNEKKSAAANSSPRRSARTRGKKEPAIEKVDEIKSPAPKPPKPTQRRSTRTRGIKEEAIVKEEEKPSPRHITQDQVKKPPATEEVVEESTPPKPTTRRTTRGLGKKPPVTKEVAKESTPPKPTPRRTTRGLGKKPPVTKEVAKESTPPKPTPRRTTRGQGKKVPATEEVVKEATPPKPSPKRTTRATRGRQGKKPPVTEEVVEESTPPKPTPRRTTRGQGKKVPATEEVAKEATLPKPSPRRTTRATRGRQGKKPPVTEEVVKESTPPKPSPKRTARTTRGHQGKKPPVTEEVVKESTPPKPTPRRTTRGQGKKVPATEEVVKESTPPKPSPKRTTRTTRGQGKKVPATEKEVKEITPPKSSPRRTTRTTRGRGKTLPATEEIENESTPPKPGPRRKQETDFEKTDGETPTIPKPIAKSTRKGGKQQERIESIAPTTKTRRSARTRTRIQVQDDDSVASKSSTRKKTDSSPQQRRSKRKKVEKVEKAAPPPIRESKRLRTKKS